MRDESKYFEGPKCPKMTKCLPQNHPCNSSVLNIYRISRTLVHSLLATLQQSRITNMKTCLTLPFSVNGIIQLLQNLKPDKAPGPEASFASN